ncbi:uncharacterized protein LOC143266157 [Megachile rotundata]|uniref:uncharacterized protein LOC143266157 n=1 Tax=Megachile rotundata TaxID=143995 RepID=UPI003FD19AF4
MPHAVWRHIPSADNPADLASRGLSGKRLGSSNIWWKGPTFLSQHNPDLNNYLLSNLVTDKEARTSRLVCSTVTSSSFLEQFISRYSSVDKLCRITCWCLRFGNRNRQNCLPRLTTDIGVDELLNARLTLIRCIENIEFSEERALLDQSASISRGPLSRLNPFLDERGILRVGGRLKHSLLDFNEKHPIILPKRGHFTTLIIREAHSRTLHGGVQLTLGFLRERYWILCGRRAVRTYVFSCVTCWRWRAKTAEQQMGNLPLDRVRPSRPFINTGIDYAGPFVIKTSPGRCLRSRKAYVAVFVCLASRAVHLELVSDYTTDAFLAAYRRFVSRRGMCSLIRSDQRTTFIDAQRELHRLFQNAQIEWSTVANNLAKEGTVWQFNPPSAPHFGGIWEAAVKSLNFHLRRVVGDTLLTFEKLTTVLAQIEACLNSRPLAPLGDSTDSFDFLTPGHFLIGGPLVSVPEPTLIDEKTSRLSRWQLVQQMRDHFWRRWAAEYLNTLQTRSKWSQPQPNVKPGDLCLITSEVTPPTKWPVGRIIEVYPGSDGKVRVVLVRTPQTTLKRPVAKLCLFPETQTSD